MKRSKGYVVKISLSPNSLKTQEKYYQKKGNTMIEIGASEEWLDECSGLVNAALSVVAKKLYEKHGNSVAFPMFLHVAACTITHMIYEAAPNVKEADRFVKAAHDEVKENFNKPTD